MFWCYSFYVDDVEYFVFSMQIELVRKEMSWDAEKHVIGLRKLQIR